jgi:hypothetical protein
MGLLTGIWEDIEEVNERSLVSVERYFNRLPSCRRAGRTVGGERGRV